MAIRRAERLPYALPLRQPWRSSRGEFTVRRGWLVRLTTDDGRAGYGDTAPLPEAGTEGFTLADQALRALLPLLVGREVDEALAALPPAAATPAARCGVETALLDLAAQYGGVPLARWLAPTVSSQVPTATNVGALDGEVLSRVQAALARGFAVLKVKVGLASAPCEIDRLHALAATLPAGAQLRLDANRAWDPATARTLLAACAALPVEMVEEPLAAPDVGRLAALQGETAIPLALDETLARGEPEAWLAAAPTRRVVLKPTTAGGPLAAWRLALLARQAGVEPLVTTAVESAAGVWAAAQLAAALGDGPAHGLDTARWLAEDTGAAPPIERGVLSLPPQPGLGYRPDAESDTEA